MNPNKIRRLPRIGNLLLPATIATLGLTFIATFLGLAGITLYAVTQGTLSAHPPYHEPALQPTPAHIARTPRWQITAPVIIGVPYSHGWGFDRILAADIIRNGGIIDEFEPRRPPVGNSRFHVRISRSYAERLLSKTAAGEHVTPGYREWSDDEPDTSAPRHAEVAAEIVVRQRLYPSRALARTAVGMAIIAFGSIGLLLLIYWYLILGIKNTGTPTERS